MVTLKVQIDDTQIREKIRQIPGKMKSINQRMLGFICEAAIARSQRDYLRGSKSALHWVSGKLAQSETYKVADWHADLIVGAKYGAIHEFGGTILPKKGKFLRWVKDGKEFFAKKVVMPKRPFFLPAIEETFTSGEATRVANTVLQEELDKHMGAT